MEEAYENGARVVRVATHCTEADTGIQHIQAAKKMGMMACGFLMMIHMASPEKLLEEKEELTLLQKAVSTLSERDQTVLSLYYYEEFTLKEIGKVLNVSESRVCQLHSRAIVNLRNTLKKMHF